MKKIFKTGGCIIFAALILGLVGCPIGNDNGYTTAGDVDWTNYTSSSDRAFMVRNDSNKRLVAFKGNLMQANILGGIPNNSNGHGIKRNPQLLFNNEAFPMILITEEDYVNHKSDLTVLENTPYTRIFVFYNSSGDNDVVYNISTRLGGNKILEIGNNSPTLNVEIRLGGIAGETIGYAPAGKLITKLYVTEGDYDLFPVFKRYNATRNEVETLYPRGTTGIPYFKALAFDQNNSAYFNVSEAQSYLSNLTNGVAWLAINNQTNMAIHLVTGSNIVRTTTGVSYFNNGESKTFPIQMPAQGQTFASTVTLASYSVGPNTYEKPILTADGDSTFTLQADKLYTVTVTGNAIENTLKAVIDLSTPTNVPVDAL